MSAYALRSRPDIALPAWARPISTQLDLVETTLDAVAASDVSVATDMSSRLFAAGGKRIRPALALLSALANGADGSDERLIDFAASTELVHSASLLHDDVVDETRARRGVLTANATWGNKLSVLGGDFLLSKAFALLARVRNLDILSALSSSAVAMTEGEMLQAASEGSLQAWQENYWRIIRGKTAALMGACCECGAILAGTDPTVRESMASFGIEIGLAFQITDDLLDISGDPAVTGKEIGADLTNGKFTLPILLALERCPEEAAKLSSGEATAAEAKRLATLAVECGAAEAARRMAVDHVQSARSQLASLPASEYTAALDLLASSLADRGE